MDDAGIPKTTIVPAVDMSRLMAEVRANRDKLDACPRHFFPSEVPGIEGGVASMFGRKIECKRCGGKMDLVNLNYYVRGYEANGGDGNDVLPGWKDKPGNERRFFKPPEDA